MHASPGSDELHSEARSATTAGHPPRLVLASRSPRRSAVLEQLGLAFLLRPADVDETPRTGESPGELADRLARAKASAAVRPGELAFGFDTVVELDGDILGKPGSTTEAVEMIERLGGRTHRVYSGIAAAADGRVESALERTIVKFRRVRSEEAEAYVATGEPLDKAGAYGIQGVGAALVERVEGDFFNVMGFPIQRFQDLLVRFGWRYGFGEILAVADVPRASRPA
ncbi:MAG: nucleoside triphosphate pyrophosphatase [Gemmatimonadota bacterium]|nr:nucleoside triphosphate pyrophosphatase [Gemmatimonadota bacterium]